MSVETDLTLKLLAVELSTGGFFTRNSLSPSANTEGLQASHWGMQVQTMDQLCKQGADQRRIRRSARGCQPSGTDRVGVHSSLVGVIKQPQGKFDDAIAVRETRWVSSPWQTGRRE